MLRWMVAMLCMVLMVPTAHGGAGPSGGTVYHSFDMQVPRAPVPAAVDGRATLLSELHVTNFAAEPLEIDRVEVLDASVGRVIVSLGADDLARGMVVVPADDPTTDRMIGPGRLAIVYLSVSHEAGQLPGALRHRIIYSPARSEATRAVTGADPAVAGYSEPILGAPLRGGPWTAVYDPNLTRGHRRVFYAVDGAARLPSRYAIDWMPALGFDPRTAGASGVASDGLGADVLAVADGVVVTAKDGFPDRRQHDKATDLEAETGNMIVLDLGRGRFASYQHLSLGLLVKEGDRVRRGQVIGRLGASGFALSPHLHLSVSTAAAPLSGEGLPFRMGEGRVIGAYASIADFMAGKAWRELAAKDVEGLPGPNAVVLFD